MSRHAMECENISCETERFLYFLKGKGERSRASPFVKSCNKEFPILYSFLHLDESSVANAESPTPPR